MQKIQKGEIEKKIRAVYDQLLSALDGVDEALLEQPNTINRSYSVIEALSYLAAWGIMVNKGLRDIQRRKKPMDIERAIEHPKTFRDKAVAAARGDELADILIQLDDVLYAYDDQLGQLSYDDLNRPKRLRFLGNKPLWPYIAKHTYEHDAEWADEIGYFIKRNS
ncbi:MAG: ClbS/DfsB family four-helix bundle protein [Candidatus Promineifilaceae bacterium]